jgi:hypothetical protein
MKFDYRHTGQGNRNTNLGNRHTGQGKRDTEFDRWNTGQGNRHTEFDHWNTEQGSRNMKYDYRNTEPGRLFFFSWEIYTILISRLFYSGLWNTPFISKVFSEVLQPVRSNNQCKEINRFYNENNRGIELFFSCNDYFSKEKIIYVLLRIFRLRSSTLDECEWKPYIAHLKSIGQNNITFA